MAGPSPWAAGIGRGLSGMGQTLMDIVAKRDDKEQRQADLARQRAMDEARLIAMGFRRQPAAEGDAGQTDHGVRTASTGVAVPRDGRGAVLMDLGGATPPRLAGPGRTVDYGDRSWLLEEPRAKPPTPVNWQTIQTPNGYVQVHPRTGETRPLTHGGNRLRGTAPKEPTLSPGQSRNAKLEAAKGDAMTWVRAEQDPASFRGQGPESVPSLDRSRILQLLRSQHGLAPGEASTVYEEALADYQMGAKRAADLTSEEGAVELPEGMAADIDAALQTKSPEEIMAEMRAEGLPNPTLLRASAYMRNRGG